MQGIETLNGVNAAIAAADAAPDRTATGKEHFEVLDGLRGTAALLVVMYHIQGMMVFWQASRLMLPHAVLAVDFFFVLSGFVIGYAYDDRWDRMTAVQFLKIRLVRLHPLVVLGMLLGLASYLFDPFAAMAEHGHKRQLLLAFCLGLLLLPSGPLPNRFPDTHPLNTPCWSLLMEYVGNLAYAFALRRLRACSLGILALLSGALLVACAVHLGSLAQGAHWSSFWMAPVQLCFPFVTGLWLYRVRNRLPRLRIGWLPLSLVLTAIVAIPLIPSVGELKLNGLYEVACVVLLFPFIVVAGSHSDPGRGMLVVCKASSRISYPIYVTHYPFLYIWTNFVAHGNATQAQLVAIGVLLFLFLLLIAWAAYMFWDVPIRRHLRSSLRPSKISA